MTTKNYLLLLFFGLMSWQAAAQEGEMPENYCGYTGMSPWLTWYHEHKAELLELRGADTTWLYVPVTVHLVGNDNGFGYYPTVEAIRAVCEMNQQYVQARIHFYLMPGEPFVSHNSTEWNDHDWQGGADLIQSTRIPGRLNAYIVSDPAGNCGYSWHDAIVLSRNCSGPGNSTWAHEAGHHLSLPHPFFGWEGEEWDYSQPAPQEWEGWNVEKMDGSNCYNSGDRFCDTRPDYLNYRWPCNDNHESIVLQHDPNGVEFRSDATLFMSYSYDNCASRFSPEQIEAMRTNLYTEHSEYLQEFELGPQIDDSTLVAMTFPIDSQTVQYDNITFTWDAVPNATLYTVQVSVFPTFPMFLVNQTVYNVNSITITNNIPKNRTLYWRVRAYNEWDLCQPSGWPSRYQVFKTRDLSSTSELDQIADLSLTPNPVSGGNPAVLTVINDETLDVQLRLTDASGRVCYQQQYRLFGGDNQIEIPTSNLPAGMYFVSLQTNKGAVNRRLAVTE